MTVHNNEKEAQQQYEEFVDYLIELNRSDPSTAALPKPLADFVNNVAHSKQLSDALLRRYKRDIIDLPSMALILSRLVDCASSHDDKLRILETTISFFRLLPFKFALANVVVGGDSTNNYDEDYELLILFAKFVLCKLSIAEDDSDVDKSVKDMVLLSHAITPEGVDILDFILKICEEIIQEINKQKNFQQKAKTGKFLFCVVRSCQQQDKKNIIRTIPAIIGSANALYFDKFEKWIQKILGNRRKIVDDYKESSTNLSESENDVIGKDLFMIDCNNNNDVMNEDSDQNAELSLKSSPKDKNDTDNVHNEDEDKVAPLPKVTSLSTRRRTRSMSASSIDTTESVSTPLRRSARKKRAITKDEKEFVVKPLKSEVSNNEEADESSEDEKRDNLAPLPQITSTAQRRRTRSLSASSIDSDKSPVGERDQNEGRDNIAPLPQSITTPQRRMTRSMSSSSFESVENVSTPLRKSSRKKRTADESDASSVEANTTKPTRRSARKRSVKKK